MTPLARQLRWLIGIRLVVITSILLPYFLLNLQPQATVEELAPAVAQPRPPQAPGALPPAGSLTGVAAERSGPGISPQTLYTLAGLTYLASLLYIALLRLLPGRDPLQAYVQFLGDLLLITALVYVTGGIASPFSIFYLVVISVASALLRRRAGITVATAAYALYAGLLLTLYAGWLAPAHGSATVAGADTTFRLVYNLVVNLFAFYAVALLTYTLAFRITSAERELAEKREDLADLQVVHRDVIQSINSGLITTDLEGNVTSVNRAGEEILGTGAAQLVGRPLKGTPLLPEAKWREALADDDPDHKVRSDVEISRGGETAYVGFSISQLTDADGTPRGYIVIFQDLTRWRQLQEEVRLKDRMAAVGELAAGIAHEIGNPLAAISGSVQMLARSPEGTGTDRRLIDILLKESQRLDRTIKGFLRFARPRERATVLFDVAALLAENFALLENSEEVTPKHRLEIDLRPPSASLIADPDQVSQIFWNLARNALKAMPAGGTLRVSGRLGAGHYLLRFADTGHGMATDERANLFHPFKSFFDTGAGIGMAIVYRIVEEHRGTIHVDSQPGAGTTISIELPVAGVPAPALPVEAAAP